MMLASPLYYDRFVRMDGAWPFAERELCVDSSCVTPAQFQAMVAATSNPSPATAQPGPSATSDLPAPDPSRDRSLAPHRPFGCCIGSHDEGLIAFKDAPHIREDLSANLQIRFVVDRIRFL